MDGNASFPIEHPLTIRVTGITTKLVTILLLIIHPTYIEKFIKQLLKAES